MVPLESTRGRVPGRWWRPLTDGRIQCDLCPRACRLAEGQRAFCFVREHRDGQMWLTSYGRASGFCLDPIEKKPLNHFYPGSSVLSFGTAGCNLGCKFCQNWDISKAKEMDRLTGFAGPADIARAAKQAGARSVAFTYNDPVIFAEYAIDTALACREAGVATVAVTAGYMGEEARRDFFEVVDAVNIDLKAFEEPFYRRLCFADLGPVLETLAYVKHETSTWLEVTTLLIPGHNDSESEIDALCRWFVDNLGPETPLHFSAFHPDFKMTNVPRTPVETLFRARRQALGHGIRHVYTGNVHDTASQSTTCTGCGQVLIERNWYVMGTYALDAQGRCNACDTPLAGRFDAQPGTWGARRMPIHIG